MITDPISDMLTRIRNGLAVGKTDISLPYSNFKQRLATILTKEGYLAGVEEVTSPYRNLVIKLKYVKGVPAIRHVQRVSKPGSRFYASKEDIPRVLSGLGISVVSTSQGLMTNKEAKQKNLGGEIVCEVY